MRRPGALTLTPALCALLLRPAGAARRRWLARVWNVWFARLTAGYDRTVRHIVRRSVLAVVVLAILTGVSYLLLRTVPTGFAPTEDQGYLLVNVQLPAAASLERTGAVVRQIEQVLLATPGIETVVAIGGRSFISGVNGPNVASLFPRLTPWSSRLSRLANDVYAQIGLALLIGLASKNAILIVEFAREHREHGLDIRQAAREAARLRFRPILMTSFAFILGSTPLVFASGAGAASRHSIGTTVVAGMLAVTVLGVLLVPAFDVAVERLAKWRRRPHEASGSG